jgi:MoxR-like ATPase
MGANRVERHGGRKMRAGYAKRVQLLSPGDASSRDAAKTNSMQYTKHPAISYLRTLRVFGFDELEPVILAALVSEDPILLIGRSGTGKTYLLNSISEAMRLEHRHYNASLISFDDLVGYPYPSADGGSVSFLPTPATIWGAQSVLVDEISRCKPETQNKFFALVHERKMQGMPLESLVYRWAAMNPFSLRSDDNEEQYTGSEPLDPALADRFGFVIEVPDWPALSKDDQEAVIDPSGEAVLSDDNEQLLRFVEQLKPVFWQRIAAPSFEVVSYARLVTGLMTDAGLRFSPRRARLLARNLTAVICVAEALQLPVEATDRKFLYKECLRWSIPHRAYREVVANHLIDSVHAEACRQAFSTDARQQWISEFLSVESLPKKITMLFDTKVDRDTKSLAVTQLMGRDTVERRAIFAFSTFPAFDNKHNLLTEDALDALVKTASQVMEVKGKLEWQESFSERGTGHPTLSRCRQFLGGLQDTAPRRTDRAMNLFLYLITQGRDIPHPEVLETQLNNCFETIKRLSGL